MKYKSTIIAIILVLVLSCEKDKNPMQSIEYGGGSDYQIYQEVLSNWYSETNYLVILHDSTVNIDIDSNQVSSIKHRISEIKDKTIENYYLRNMNTNRLKNIPSIDFYIFESEYKESDKDIVRIWLSEIGYDNEETQAIVAMGETYGPLAGGGILFFLVKEDEVWKVSSVYGLWIC